jgi:hypothetical protein
MVVTAVLLLCIGAVVALFVAQRKRDKENADDTARLRALGSRWSDWFDSDERTKQPQSDRSYSREDDR